MARRSTRGRGRNRAATSGSRVPRVVRIRRSIRRPITIVIPLEDRRLYHPDGPARKFTGSNRDAVRMVDNKNVNQRPYRTRIAFADPRKVYICMRRAIRREVLFAAGVAGKKGIRKRRTNETSKISCRR